MTACHGDNWLKECPYQQIKQKREAFFGGVIMGMRLYSERFDETIVELKEYSQQLTQRL